MTFGGVPSNQNYSMILLCYEFSRQLGNWGMYCHKAPLSDLLISSLWGLSDEIPGDNCIDQCLRKGDVFYSSMCSCSEFSVCISEINRPGGMTSFTDVAPSYSST